MRFFRLRRIVGNLAEKSHLGKIVDSPEKMAGNHDKYRPKNSPTTRGQSRRKGKTTNHKWNLRKHLENMLSFTSYIMIQKQITLSIPCTCLVTCPLTMQSGWGKRLPKHFITFCKTKYRTMTKVRREHEQAHVHREKKVQKQSKPPGWRQWRKQIIIWIANCWPQDNIVIERTNVKEWFKMFVK